MIVYLTFELQWKTIGALLWDTVLDLLKILPFLFLTYLLMEFLEHKAKEKTLRFVRSCGRFGPLVGAAAGVFPQCGFSASAAGLFSGGIISVGTLVAVFLSTSDEMLPILISNMTPFPQILKILGVKLLCAAITGLALDTGFRMAGKQKAEKTIRGICQQENCNCHNRGILRSAVHHTFEVLLFIGICSLGLNILILLIGEETIGAFLTTSVFGPAIASLVGLIPNCASSVLITQLWVEGALTSGAMIGGLLTGSGIGLLMLFKTNRPMKENLFVLTVVYAAGVLFGTVLDLIGFVL